MPILFGLQFIGIAIITWVLVISTVPVAVAVGTFYLSAVPSLESAIFVLENDRDRVRAFICSVFLVAAGVFRAAVFALVVFILFGFFANRRGQRPDEEMMYTMMQMLLGLVAAMGISLIALVTTLITRRRVWINPKLIGLLDKNCNFTPPLKPALYVNYAVPLVVISSCAPFLGTIGFLLVTPRGDWIDMALLLLLAVSALVFSCLCLKRTIAPSPMDCWHPTAESR